MQEKLRVIFRWTPYNHYSLSVIFGFLDEHLDPAHFEIITGEDEKDIVSKAKVSGLAPVAAYSFASTEFHETAKEIRSLKAALKDKIVIIAGGPHATALPESLLECGADAVFTGETEESLPDFLIRYREAGRLPEERVIKPLPLEDFDLYPAFAYKRKFFGPIELRRGCTDRCSFCQTPGIFTKVRERSINFVKKYVEYMRAVNRKRITFIIPDVLSYGLKGGKVNLQFLEEFLKELSRYKMQILLGNFPSEVFPGRLAGNPDAAALLKKYVTNKSIIVGGQSGCDETLKLMKRNHTAAHITDSVKLLKKAGFLPIVDIMLGMPGETRGSRLKTMAFVKDLSRKHGVRFNMHYFMPLPGTVFYGKTAESIEDSVKNEVAQLIKHGVVHGDFFSQIKYSQKENNG